MCQNMSLGSNGVDRVQSLLEIPTRLRGMNFCSSSARLAPSFVKQSNCPGCTQIVRHAPKCQFRVQWGGLGAFFAKIPTWLHGTNFCTSSARCALSYIRQPNSMKCTKTSVLDPMGWIGCVRYKKFRRNSVARTFGLVRPVLHRVS